MYIHIPLVLCLLSGKSAEVYEHALQETTLLQEPELADVRHGKSVFSMLVFYPPSYPVDKYLVWTCVAGRPWAKGEEYYTVRWNKYREVEGNVVGSLGLRNLERIHLPEHKQNSTTAFKEWCHRLPFPLLCGYCAILHIR